MIKHSPAAVKENKNNRELIMTRLYCLISTVCSLEIIAAAFTRALSPDTHQLKTLTLKRDAQNRRPSNCKENSSAEARLGNHGDRGGIAA